MNIHRLEAEKHQDFLNEERIDPITGDLLQKNDKIVICANCKCAFLVDSWHYINSKHCNQTHTLKEIPIQKTVKISKESRNERLNNLAFFQFRTVKQSEVRNIYTGFLGLIAGIFVGLTILLGLDFVSLGLMAGLLVLGVSREMYKQKSLVLNSGYLLINQNKKDVVMIKNKDIKTIHTQKAKFFSRLANSILFNKKEDFYHLIITTKTGKTHKVFLSEHEVKRIETETNILKKYAHLTNTQPSINMPLITTPSNNDLNLPF